MRTRRDFLRSLGLGAAALCCSRPLGAAAAEHARPNVLLVIADDMGAADCGCYGSPDVKTPHIDRLARDGMRFTHCFTATAMCAPTRQQLYTGIFPVRNGAYPNHSRVHPGTRSVVHHLKALGYRVGLIGKTHFGPRECFPFEILRGGKRGADNVEAITQFITRDKTQPFCLIVCSNHPHGPWTAGPKDLYKPETLTVPPYLVDTPETRKGLASYFAEISALDTQVGACTRAVDDAGVARNTLLIFTSEQGSSFPFGGKWTCYETGLRTAFVVRWPARVEAGSTTDAMVQYVDVVPTLVEAAGGDPAKINTGRPGAPAAAGDEARYGGRRRPDGGTGFDGRSFLPVLLGEAREHRECVYGAHTTRGIINGSPCYPIRSARTRRWKYIRNLNHATPFTNAVTRGKGVLASWARAGQGDPRIAARARFYQHRPAEELYDLQADPYELHNVAGEAKHGAVLADLRKRLDAWMAQQGDKGNATEMKANERQGRRRGKRRRPANSKEKSGS